MARLAASLATIALLTVVLLRLDVNHTTVALSYIIVILSIATGWGMAEALATSIARSADTAAGGCHHRRDAWFCTDGDSRMYRATVGDYGCWEAVKVTPAGKIASLEPVYGCVNLPDFLGIGH